MPVARRPGCTPAVPLPVRQRLVRFDVFGGVDGQVPVRPYVAGQQAPDPVLFGPVRGYPGG